MRNSVVHQGQSSYPSVLKRAGRSINQNPDRKAVETRLPIPGWGFGRGTQTTMVTRQGGRRGINILFLLSCLLLISCHHFPSAKTDPKLEGRRMRSVLSHWWASWSPEQRGEGGRADLELRMEKVMQFPKIPGWGNKNNCEVLSPKVRVKVRETLHLRCKIDSLRIRQMLSTYIAHGDRVPRLPPDSRLRSHLEIWGCLP